MGMEPEEVGKTEWLGLKIQSQGEREGKQTGGRGKQPRKKKSKSEGGAGALGQKEQRLPSEKCKGGFWGLVLVEGEEEKKSEPPGALSRSLPG